jgi:type I restriction enzyme S subunit
MKWGTCALGECATLVNGRAYKQEELLDSGTPVLRIQNLNGGDRWYFSDLELPQDKYCEKGDLLFAWSASFGPYIWDGPRSIYHYHIWKIIPGESLDKKFFYHLLAFLTERVRGESHGASMLHMTKARMEAMEIPLPPLEEQRRIAAILDKADVITSRQNEALRLTLTISRSLFLGLFGDPRINTKSWPEYTLGELGRVVTGSTPPSSQRGMFDGPIPFVTPGDLGSSKQPKRSVTEAGALRSRTVKRGSALVCCIGTIGKMDIARQVSAFNQQINAVEWGDSVLGEYGLEALRFFDKELAKAAASTTVPILKKSSFQKVRVPVPPIDLQREFRRRLEAVDGHSRRLHKALKITASLEQSLLSRAFSGGL